MPHTNFTFPLNVYAQALYLEEGYFNYLHYGFNVEQGIHKAQQDSTDFILRQLPPAPASILEVGIGIGTTAKQLVKLGYDYTGVVPDPAQITYCNDKKINLIESNFESLPNTKQYDIILFQESAQYIASNILLEKSYNLLKPKSYLLILDEIATEAVNKLTTSANQIGFELTVQNDFTAKASPSIAYLIEIIFKHRLTLLHDLKISSFALTQLLYQLEIRNKEYQEKSFSYCFFKLYRS